MSGFLEALAVLSLKGAAVAALIGLVLLAAGERVPPALRHLLWLVVFARLLAPVVPASPVSLLALAPGEGAGRLLPGLDLALAGGAAAGAGGAAGAEAAGGEALAAALLGLWLLGFLAVAGRAAFAELRLRRHLRRRPALADRRALALLAAACRAAGVRRRVRLVETPRVGSPALLGFLRPRILLPPGFAAAADDRSLAHVLLHEAIHLRRLDLPLRAVAWLAAALHWFNPAAWLALGRLDAECELACDAAALARLAHEERREYGLTLLRAAVPVPRRAEAATVAALPLATHRNLRRRITMIARFHPVSRRRLALLSLAVLAVAAVALTEAPASAAPPSAADRGAIKQTMTTLRETGLAMFLHATDDGAEDAPRPAPREDDSPFDWRRCPAISHGELAALLVPERLRELPATDAWGHPLQFCLDAGATPAGHLLGIRSPGRDGRYESDAYVGGPFSPDDPDRDLVWMDGVFVRWAQKD